ncbi:MAG: hypothetical protein LBR74_01385 [Eubacterium sp.]|jgi:hypothetical protein|nr:hypothetical protein [Eubacterium sp.]
MQAVHAASFLPQLSKTGIKSFKIEKFDLYCMVLSALVWRRSGGNITLHADKVSFDYYTDIGLKGIWDSIANTIPDDFEGINPKMFWAAGKLFALRETSAPIVMIDTDFIVWENPEFGNSIIAAHYETISDMIYPDFTYFEMKPDYHFNPSWSKAASPLNTAFLYLPDEGFKQYYVNKSIDFMKHAEDCDDFLCRMVFAEQRLLSVCAEELKMPVQVLLNKNRVFFPQKKFTHLWGAKRIMREDKRSEKEFTDRCKNRILSDFPEYGYAVEIIENI